jgi:hypothetical protein
MRGHGLTDEAIKLVGWNAPPALFQHALHHGKDLEDPLARQR